MTDQELFTVVGIRPETAPPPAKKRRFRGKPVVSGAILLLIVLGCLFAEALMTKDPAYLDASNFNRAPNGEFLFGTDTLGRDIFSCIWYGGRISIFIGFFATLLSTVIAVIYGAVSGMAPRWLDSLMMRLTEIFLSVPSLLVVLFLQAIFGKANVLSISLTIGVTGWFSVAKIVRTEVRRLKSAEYVVASKAMGGGFFHILGKHLTPNFVSAIMFMVVMNVMAAIAAESTLSFIGMGLPLEIISWGSMLSLADKALLTGSWWMVLIPGGFLVTLMMCITNIANFLRGNLNQKESYLQ